MSVPPPCRPGNGGSAADATETAGELLRLRLWLLRPLGLRRHLVLLRPCLVLLLLLPELQHLRLRLVAAAAAAAALRLRLRRLLLDLLRDAELERPIARAKSPHNRGCWLAGKIEPTTCDIS